MSKKHHKYQKHQSYSSHPSTSPIPHPPSFFASPIAISFYIIILTCITCWPLLHSGLISGHDIGSYVTKSQLFFNALKAGQFPVRWIDSILPGMGQPHFQFYQPLFFYLTSIPQFLGIHHLYSIYLTLFSTTLLGIFGIYLLSKNLVRGLPHLYYLLPPLLFVFSPYRLSQLYVRAAFSEYLAASLLPWCFLGLLLIIRNHQSFLSHLPLPALSIAALIISHPPTALIAAPFLAIFILLISRSSLKTLILPLTSLTILISCLTAFYTLPIVFESKFVSLNKLSSDYYNYQLHFATPLQLIYSKWDYGLSQMGINDSMSFSLGLPLWITLITTITIFVIKRKTYLLNPQLLVLPVFLFVSTLVALWLTTQSSLPIWNQFSLLMTFIQYPWRFLSLAIIFASLSILFIDRHPSVYISLAALALCGIIWVRPSTYLTADKFNLDNPNIQQLALEKDVNGGLESGYMPNTAHNLAIPATPERAIVIDNQAVLETIINTPHHQSFVLKPTSNTLNSTTIRFHTHYFPGWQVVNSHNLPLPIITNPNGFIETTISPITTQFSLKFQNTPVRNIGNTISLISSLIIFSLLAYRASNIIKLPHHLRISRR